MRQVTVLPEQVGPGAACQAAAFSPCLMNLMLLLIGRAWSG